MTIDREGNVYLVSAKPSRIYRFTPDPKKVHDARDGKQAPYVDLAALTGNPKMKSENALVDDQGRIYVTSGDAYDYQGGAGGVVWRVTPLGGR
jgi:sugar lactone lactonase YvrE